MKAQIKSAIVVMATIAAMPSFAADYFEADNGGDWNYLTHGAGRFSETGYHTNVSLQAEDIFYYLNLFSGVRQTATNKPAMALCHQTDRTGNINSSSCTTVSNTLKNYGSVILNPVCIFSANIFVSTTVVESSTGLVSNGSGAFTATGASFMFAVTAFLNFSTGITAVKPA